MLSKRRKAAFGFTLVELIVVVVIIGILAAIAMPVMQNFRTRAMVTEAMTTISRIRSGLQAYYIEYNVYPTSVLFRELSYKGGQPQFLGIKSGELTGAYFTESAYSISSTDGTTYKIWCSVGPTTAPLVYQLTDNGNSGSIYYDSVDKKFYENKFSKSGLGEP